MILLDLAVTQHKIALWSMRNSVLDLLLLSQAIASVVGKTSESFCTELEGYGADEMIDRSNICLFDGH